MGIGCFYAGMAFFYYRHYGALCLLGMSLYFRKQSCYLIWFLSAFALAWFHQILIRPKGMPDLNVVPQIAITGVVASIPHLLENKTQFDFELDAIHGHSAHAHILVSCYTHCPAFHAGEYWQLLVKLKKPINLANPGGFDFVEKLATHHQFWLATVNKSPLNRHLTSQDPLFSLERMRAHLANALQKYCHDRQTLAVIEALALGVTTHLQTDDWDLFRRTGTTHLMVISGSHIGLIAGLVYLLLRRTTGYMSALCLRIPAQRIAAIGAFLFVTIYALLAGFEVPLQRSLFGCGILLLRYFLNQKLTAWQAWRYGLFAVLCYEPHSVCMPGFYLSFIAVAILMIVGQRSQLPNLWKMIPVQVACTLGLMPLSLFWFGYGSFNGVLANVLAIPWVEFLLVPLSVFVVLCSGSSLVAWIIPLLQAMIALLMRYLAWVDHFQMINIEYAWPQWFAIVVFMVVCGFLYCLPLKRFWIVGWVGIVCAWNPASVSLKKDELCIDVLDVGQGLAVVLRTAQHVLIYDTGGQYFKGKDMGEMVILPYLAKMQIRALDGIIISHPDLDHRGGLNSILKHFSGTPVITNHGPMNCHELPDWTWDGVLFEFFALQDMSSKNNDSCVLKITAGEQSILLTGDIEREAEQYLVRQYAEKLSSNIMLVPHHGSQSSSSAIFLDTVAPRLALLSYGLDNRYHLPNENIILTYFKRKIALLDTFHCGMISLKIYKNNLKAKCFADRL
jgi:competence protein ComEC